MAASQGNLEVKIVEVLEQLVQENRALKVEVGAMRGQIAEMMGIMQTLKNGIIAKATATENPGGIETIVPSPKPDALPLPGPGIKHLAHTPEATGQNHPATQTLNPIIMSQKSSPDFIPPPIATPQVQNLNPKNRPQALHFSTQARKSHKTSKYREQFDPIPTSYSDLLNHLLSNDLISLRPMRPLQPPFPKNYDPKAVCKFHMGAVGHSTEDCCALKDTIQDLIESKCLSFGDSSVSGVHAKGSREISAMINQGKSSESDSIPMTYTDLCSHLVRLNVISPREMKPVQPPYPTGYNPEASCEFHAGAIGHSAENCFLLKHLVQGLIDTKQLTFTEDGACQIRSG